MKRTGRLFEQIVDRDNLRHAFYQARRHKRRRSDVEQFSADLEGNLQRMATEILAGCYPIGRYLQFTIYDPKQRVITAPCFAERVLHHAIMNVCEPVFERFLIADTFACRHGKGRIAALHRAMQYSARYAVAAKLDMRKYFDSIRHEILLEKLARRFKERRLLALFRQIIASYEKTSGRGLPIGSLTSQHLANFYLAWFDHFVKEQLKVRGYVRYMDDCVLFAADKRRTSALVKECRGFLNRELDLELKTVPTITASRHGWDFLGCRVFGDHLQLNRRSRRRFRRKLRDLVHQFIYGERHAQEFQQRLTSLLAFTRAGGTKSWKFRRAVLEQIAVSGHRARTG